MATCGTVRSTLDAYLARVTAAGCEIVTPPTAIPGVGWFAQRDDEAALRE